MIFASIIIASAIREPVECRLIDIYSEYGWDPNDELSNREQLIAILEEFSLEIIPSVGRETNTCNRVLRSTTANARNDLRELVSEGETSVVEFKSSLVFDRRKFEHLGAQANKQDCYSITVLHSTLKTIAGFMNTSGGTLFIGIKDNHEVSGIEDDFEFLDPAKRNFDGFDLFLRSKVDANFISGQQVNAYLKIQLLDYGDKKVAVCMVAAKRNLTFLRKDNRPALYIRRGTSTTEIPFEDVESYFEIRKTF